MVWRGMCVFQWYYGLFSVTQRCKQSDLDGSAPRQKCKKKRQRRQGTFTEKWTKQKKQSLSPQDLQTPLDWERGSIYNLVRPAPVQLPI